MLSRVIALLRPSSAAVRELALRETDPQHAHEFEPITMGPLVNGAILCAVTLLAVAAAPARIALRLVRRS